MSKQNPVNLSVELAGLDLANPVMNASGTLGLESSEVVDFAEFGALVTKGVTLEPRSGNPTPRLCETSCGVINSIGLENSGLGVFLSDELPCWLSFGVPVIVNISGADVEEYVEISKALDKTGIAAIEVNISCPNREGIIIGTDAYRSCILVDNVRQATSLPLIVKLTPNVTDIVGIAKSVISSGADNLSLVNTFLAMDIDIDSAKPKLRRGFGGLSGPSIMPQALFKVWQVCQVVNVPVIGMGGISCFQDACKFLMAGASAVAVGTANFTNPLIIPRIISDLERWMAKKGFNAICEIPQLNTNT